jgi:pterin-4a-carbinolamine dehydratase
MEELYEEINKLAGKYNLHIKVDNNIIKLYDNKIDTIKKALVGLNDVIELAYTTAEHHPYWGLLYNTIEITRRVLERWDDNLNEEDVDELLWRVEEIRNMLMRFKY